LVPGLGSHVSWDERLDGRLAQAVVSIQAVKGVSVGEAWEVAGLPGSESHDEIFHSEDSGWHRKTNRAGGVEGGMSNGEPLFEREGEEAFRRREEEVVLAALQDAGAGAVALGGGAVLSERVRRALAGHPVAWIPVAPEVAWERVSRKGGRPLARDPESFERLH